MEAWPELPVNRPVLYCGPMSHPQFGPEPSPLRATPLEYTRGLADGIASTLRIARDLAVAGRRIDLDGLDGPIGLLCAKSLDLPPEQGRQMRVVLITLLRDVDALSAALRASPDHAA